MYSSVFAGRKYADGASNLFVGFIYLVASYTAIIAVVSTKRDFRIVARAITANVAVITIWAAPTIIVFANTGDWIKTGAALFASNGIAAALFKSRAVRKLLLG